MNGDWPNGAVDDADYIEIQRFLHHEAALLDRRAYAEWLDLLTDDITYRIMAQVARYADAESVAYAIVDEGPDTLKLRVAQISDPKLTHAENPPTLTRRFLSNFQPRHAVPPDTFVVEANLLVYRIRATAPDGGFYVGQREDVLRRDGGGLRLARREVRLDHTSLKDGAMSLLL